MKLRFWGVRGSFAMCGKEFLRYGGNTACVEILADRGSRLVIDLGTGATELGRSLMSAGYASGKSQLAILLTHTHLDHIQGLPFFSPFFVSGNRVQIFGAELPGLSLASTLQNQLAPHYSPLGALENLSAAVDVKTFAPGAPLEIDGFKIATAVVPHGNMWTTAFRITADGKTIAVLTDVEYVSPDQPTAEARAIAAGVDLLVHDAMHADAEYELRRGWGHSPVKAALGLAITAGAKRLALFHHSPDSTDEMIDAMVATAQAQTKIPVFGAAEGEYLTI